MQQRRTAPVLGGTSPRAMHVPLASPGEDVVAPSQFCGFLLKRGPTKKHDYKLRWCHVDTAWLKYYKTQKDTKPLGMISLRDVRSFFSSCAWNSPPANTAAELVFCLTMSESAGGRELVFAAMSDDTKETWISVLQRNIDALNPALPARVTPSLDNGSSCVSAQSTGPLELRSPRNPPPRMAAPEVPDIDDEHLSGYAEELLRQIEQNALMEDETDATATICNRSEEGYPLLAVCRCVRDFEPTDRTQQLEARVGDMFSVIEAVGKEWLLVRRLDRNEAGHVPQWCVARL
jgi:hypothetical protein